MPSLNIMVMVVCLSEAGLQNSRFSLFEFDLIQIETEGGVRIGRAMVSHKGDCGFEPIVESNQ